MIDELKEMLRQMYANGSRMDPDEVFDFFSGVITALEDLQEQINDDTIDDGDDE